MPAPSDDHVSALRAHASEAAGRAHTPYSKDGEAAALLLSDGSWIPGVRVESASFSLVIPPLLNAWTTAVSLGRDDVVAAVMSRSVRDEELLHLEQAVPRRWDRAAPDLLVLDGVDLPPVGDRLPPYLDARQPEGPADGVDLAREVARRAHIPESNFPVGCVLVTREGRLIPGVNVEHTDWSRILCAERNAVGTAISYGLRGFRALYLSCPKDPLGSPCGACRQVLAELAPEAVLWMDRGRDAPAAESLPEHLLPGYFTGHAL